MWLTALVNALPQLGTIARDVINHDDKAATAAQVANDPKAPPEVRQAAANVAQAALADKHQAETQAMKAATGGTQASGGGAGAGTAAAILGLLWLLA